MKTVGIHAHCMINNESGWAASLFQRQRYLSEVLFALAKTESDEISKKTQ